MTGCRLLSTPLIGNADWQRWLDAPPDAIADLMRPYTGTDLQTWPVDRQVSRTAEDDASLIAPVELDTVSS